MQFVGSSDQLKIKHIKALFFLILGLQIFFQNIKVGGGKKIKITKKSVGLNTTYMGGESSPHTFQ